ncbi:hypothetical protein TNCV_5081671 [Trichonephila clavipes]|nr:hypothetical protein TNCV_5081671 [Trichonephila clavipes]
MHDNWDLPHWSARVQNNQPTVVSRTTVSKVMTAYTNLGVEADIRPKTKAQTSKLDSTTMGTSHMMNLHLDHSGPPHLCSSGKHRQKLSMLTP